MCVQAVEKTSVKTSVLLISVSAFPSALLRLHTDIWMPVFVGEVFLLKYFQDVPISESLYVG